MAGAIPKRKLTAYFHEAQFTDKNMEMTLEEAIKASIHNLPLAKDRIISSPSDLFNQQLLNEYKPNSNHVAISIVEYEEGGTASTVAVKSNQRTISCEELKADNSEIIRRDAIAVVKGNKVISVGSNRGHEILRGHLPRLFDKAKIANSGSTIALTSRVNKETIRLIHEHGVKSIAVCSKVQLAEILNAAREHEKPNFLSNLIGAFIEEDESFSENINVWVELKKATRKQDDQLNEKMIRYASQVIDGEALDQYAIFLHGKQEPIKGGSIIQKSAIEAIRHGSSVRTHDAWQELEKLFRKF